LIRADFRCLQSIANTSQYSCTPVSTWLNWLQELSTLLKFSEVVNRSPVSNSGGRRRELGRKEEGREKGKEEGKHSFYVLFFV
jgi:hypothetical protein